MSNWDLTLYWLHVRTIRSILKSVNQSISTFLLHWQLFINRNHKKSGHQQADSSIDTVDVLRVYGVTSSCPPKLIRAFQSTCCSINSSTTTARGTTTKAATTVRKASVEVLSIYGVTTDQHSVQQLPLPFKAFWPPMDPNGSLPLLPIMPLWFSTASGSIHLLFTSWNLDVSVWYYL